MSSQVAGTVCRTAVAGLESKGERERERGPTPRTEVLFQRSWYHAYSWERSLDEQTELLDLGMLYYVVPTRDCTQAQPCHTHSLTAQPYSLTAVRTALLRSVGAGAEF